MSAAPTPGIELCSADGAPLDDEPLAADQPLPFPEYNDRGEPPERREHEAADPRRRQRDAPHRDRRRHPRPKIRPEPRAGLSRRRSGRRAPPPLAVMPIPSRRGLDNGRPDESAE